MKAIFGKICLSDGIFSRMLVNKDRIVSIDNESDAPENSIIIDYKGKLILPPLTDHHVHFFQTGLYLGALDLTEIGTKSELLSYLRRIQHDKYKIGEVLWAWGFDPLDSMPDAEELQSAAPDVPIFLRRADGHSCSLSHAAMKMLPKGKKSQSGIFSGKAHEFVVRSFLEAVHEDELIKAAERVAEYACSVGATTIHALIPYAKWAKILQRIEHDLPVRAVIFVESTDVDTVKRLGLKQIGGCLLLDGSIGSHTAAVSMPFADEPGNCGILYYSDKELEFFFRTALENDIVVAMHAIGDRAVEQYISTADKISSGKKLAGWRIEHAELVLPEQLERIEKLGITLSVQPAFETRWGGPDGLYAKRFGDKWRMTNPFRSEIEAGIKLLGGSDAYVTPIDPSGGIRSAMNHPNISQRLELTDAVSLFAGDSGSSVKLKNKILRRNDCFLVIDGNFNDKEFSKLQDKIVLCD